MNPDPTLILLFSNTGPISATLSRNTFINNAAPSNTTVCVANTAVSSRTPRLSLAGNKGLQPPKPSQNQMVPW